MIRCLTCILVVWLLLAGCKDETVDTVPPETFRGQYMVRQDDVVGSKSDSVIFHLEEGRVYRMTFFPDTGARTDFCDASGVVDEWPKNNITFNPTSVQSTVACDSARIPRGEFTAVFVADTLTCTRQANDSTYELHLIK